MNRFPRCYSYCFYELREFMHKNRLQEYAQRSSIPLPLYQTVNEGYPHAPQFRSTVMVDGATFVSSCTFSHRKEAEQDVAKLALEGISRKIKDEGISLIHADTTFCKSILHEYAAKINIEKPIYTTFQSEGGLLPSFISSLVFDGKTYTGAAGRNKKEAEQMAARAVIESILAHSNTRILMSQIIKSKGKLFAAMQQNGESGLSQQGNAAFGKPARNDSSISTVQGKEIQPAPENDDLVAVANHEQLLLGQLPVAVEARPFLPEAKKHKEEYPCEQSSGPIGNGTSLPSLAQEKEIQPAPANDDLVGVANHEQLLSGQLPAAAEAHPFLPEANKPGEEYPCEQSFGPLGNGTSLTNLAQDHLPSESPSRVLESPNESYHAQQNQVDDLAGPSMQSSDAQHEVPNSWRKRSKKKHKGGRQRKKARTEQLSSTPPVCAESVAGQESESQPA
uniref:Uncharacterized protein LOC105047090 isoform X2 n=1 Tax=Elaeis guineensis var. tenera TaxID=51953 RepID=A0A8N4IE81_ELAGV|nr:uncharacterized protein LOC105047090 isoform X2 [Elaeis guineensis]